MTQTDVDIEAVAHGICQLLNPDPGNDCQKCPLRDPGPRGGVRGCIFDAEEVARAAIANDPGRTRMADALREMIAANATCCRVIAGAGLSEELSMALRESGIADGFGARARAALGETDHG